MKSIELIFNVSFSETLHWQLQVGLFRETEGKLFMNLHRNIWSSFDDNIRRQLNTSNKNG